MSIPPLSDAVVVVAHDDPVWPGSYRVNLDVCGRPIAYGRNPHKAAALRLLEEGYSPEHMLVLRYAHNTKPMAQATIAEAAKL